MKAIPSALKAHYKSGSTSTATLFKVTLASGDQLFFTDHVQDIVYEEETYLSTSGFNTTALESHADMSVDNIDIESFISSDSGVNIGTEEGFFVSARIDRFRPMYWTVDGPRTMSFSLVTNGANSRVDFTSRMDNDFCGLIWESEDTKDHAMLAYQTNRDYRGCVIEFDLAVGGAAPALNSATQGLSMTVEGRDAAGTAFTKFVFLARYITPGVTTAPPDVFAGHVVLNFDDLRAGFLADDPVYTGDIDRVFIGVISNSWHVGATGVVLTANETGWLEMNNLHASGGNSTIIRNEGVVPAHSLGMATSYDDHYNQSPERIVFNCLALGYRTDINHYCGVSTFPEKKYDATLNRLAVINTPGGDTTNVITVPARAWHLNFANLCQLNGYNVIYSVSFETYSLYTREEWVQRDWDGRIGFTGYVPPTYLISPCNDDGQTYLQACFLAFAALMSTVPAGPSGHHLIQIGEPWWWVQTDTLKPCIYDNACRNKFHAATGLFMADIGDMFANPDANALDTAMTTFSQNELGQCCENIRTAIKATYPTIWVSILIYLPTIEQTSLTRRINRPDSHYVYPKFDFFQTEVYEWIINGEPESKIALAMTYPLTTLGYPASLVSYLPGFVPDLTSTGTSSIPPGFDPGLGAKTIWKRIFVNSHNFETYGIWKQMIWAYTIVMRDSVTYREVSSLRAFYYKGEYVQVFPPRLTGGITLDDLRSGRMDYAKVEISEVNYQDLTMGKNILRTGRLGQVSAGTLSLKAELRGLTQNLTRKIIRLTTKTCMADLGDAECKININSYTVLGTVTVLGGANRSFLASPLASYVDDWFTQGKLTFQSGENFGLSMEVRRHTHDGTVELQEQMPFTIHVGDTFVIHAGCTKRFTEDCVQKFHNGVNFRGFPHLPLEKVYTGP